MRGHTRRHRGADEALRLEAPGENTVLAIVESRDPSLGQSLFVKQPSQGGSRACQGQDGGYLAITDDGDMNEDHELVRGCIDHQV